MSTHITIADKVQITRWKVRIGFHVYRIEEHNGSEVYQLWWHRNAALQAFDPDDLVPLGMFESFDEATQRADVHEWNSYPRTRATRSGG